MSTTAYLLKSIPVSSSSKHLHRPWQPQLTLLRSTISCDSVAANGQRPEKVLSYQPSKREGSELSTSVLHLTRATTIGLPLTTLVPSEVQDVSTKKERKFMTKKKKNTYFGREWTLDDVMTAMLIGTPHVLSLFCPFLDVKKTIWAGIVFGLISGFAVSISYHRNLSHRSLKLMKWLEYLLAYCAVLALEKDPIFWASTHRQHHKHSDTLKDPHSPIEGFWFSHVSWLFDNRYQATKFEGRRYGNVPDLWKQPFYRFIHHTYYAHPIAFALLLYLMGGLPYVVGAMGVSRVVTLHCTFISTSLSHMWGTQPWNTNDNSKNNGLIALVTFGEGWHNNHHAFKYSAKIGLEWWQVDFSWYLIKLFELFGLARDIKVPSEAHKRAKAKLKAHYPMSID